MKKWLAILLMVTMVFSMSAVPAFAVTPEDTSNEMYANDYTVGDPVIVSLPAANVARLDPDNALGQYDALQSDGVAANEKFYAVASHQWTSYTFGDDFMNVDGKPDISFCEVTWGSSWHAEAALVYLSNAYVRDEDGKVVPYSGDDNGQGYLAGVAWNKVGINGISAADRNIIAESYLPDGVIRTFDDNTFSQNGNFGWTQFYLPDEVVYATDVTLVDITADVYEEAGTASTYTGNTDGYDLDAIRVYKYIPWRFNDTATGCSNEEDGTGNRILPKGTWFMYNEVDFTNPEAPVTFPIQAGNPKDGVNIIGEYTVTNNGDGTYTVVYDIDDTITMNGYIYDIEVAQEHLGISDTMSFTAKPGQDDNQDFGVPFEDADGKFCIFAHFAVEYR